MKRALITGGSRGIGAEIVRALAEKGWEVSFLYRENAARALEVAAETGAAAIRADVSIKRDVDEAVRRIGHVDLLVNNAGIAQSKLFTDLTEGDWRNMIDTNLTGVFFATQAVLPAMLSRKRGNIVNIASMWGLVGASCEVHYSASKGGVIALTKALAKEVGSGGICVNCIAPGVIDTEMNRELSQDDLRELRENTPLCRIGTVRDVANAVCFLASDEASFITGQVLGVDGGFIT
ncbi:MAG: elongation factor P 5-aminopentanone reductase [Christensenellales bacterium]|jgi:3-oxoacyl-[acyl-carrier protein] reductase